MIDNFSRRSTTTSKSRGFGQEEATSPVIQPLPRGALSRIAAVQKSSRRLHRKQAAEYIGTSLSWLDKSRVTGRGPVFICIGGRVIYDTADLDQFLQSNRHSSTSEYE